MIPDYMKLEITLDGKTYKPCHQRDDYDGWCEHCDLLDKCYAGRRIDCDIYYGICSKYEVIFKELIDG